MVAALPAVLVGRGRLRPRVCEPDRHGRAVPHSPAMRTALLPLWLMPALLGLGGCAQLSPGDPAHAARLWEQSQAPQTSESREALPTSAPWQHQTFPGKRRNHYQYVWREGRPAMAVSSEQSISALRKVVDQPAAGLGQIRFSWKVANLLAEADLQQGAKEDSPVRLVLVFDGDRSRMSAKDAMLSELARALTGEDLPYATLMYVWSNQLPVGTVVHNRRTDRIRKLVIESGPAGTNRWLDYERDIRADYERVFGEPPGTLQAVALMSDTDNTGSSVKAWYGPVQFKPLLRP